MKNKVVDLGKAMDCINNGISLMVGGFLGVGAPLRVIDAIVKKGLKDLVVVANDTGVTGAGISKLIASKTLKKVIVSHIGTNPETGKQMMSGELEVQLVPQGTLAEQIRAAGCGLGGFLTPTGVGTDIANNKDSMVVNGKQFLLELPLKADVAIIKGKTVDTFGNIIYNKTAHNFNPLMAMAANTVIVEAENIVDVGELDSNYVMTPGIFVDYVVRSESNGK